MFTVYRLVEANQEKLLPAVIDLLKASSHFSKFNGLDPENIQAEVLRIRDAGGIVMVPENQGVVQGVIVLEKKNEIEVTLVELVMRAGYEPRFVQVLISQAKRQMERLGFSQMFGSSKWSLSVTDNNISQVLVTQN